jgi:hypothetical protein
MAEVCYMARAITKQQVIKGIGKLALQTNKHGQYTHDTILLLQKGIRRILVSQFNPSNPGKGMEKLLEDGMNLLANVKLTDAIMANSVLKAAKARADVASKASSTRITPTITSQSEAQEEADRLNVINQLVISTKEGVVEAVMKLVGSDITDAVLRTANGRDHKSIDNYTLFAVMAAAIDGADQTSTIKVLEQLLEVINHTFDFRKKGQCQHGADAVKCGKNGHVWNRDQHPSAEIDAHSQHQECNQSQVWTQILISNAGYLQKNTRTTMYMMPPCYRIL